MENKTNYLAVLACIIVNMGLGMAWYGIFADPWMAGHGLTMELIEKNASTTPYIATAIGSVASGYVLSLLFQRMNVSGWKDGAIAGSAIGGLAFIATFVSYQFSMKTMLLGALDGGYMFIMFVLYGALIGGWQKK